MLHAFAATFGILLAFFVFFNFGCILRIAFWLFVAGLILYLVNHP